MNDGNKHTNLLRYGIDFYRKKFCSPGPRRERKTCQLISIIFVEIGEGGGVSGGGRGGQSGEGDMSIASVINLGPYL